MKVILLSDIAKLGRRYSVQNVSPGYASNHLIPKGLAHFASKEALKALESKIGEASKQAELDALKEAEAIKLIDGSSVTIVRKANDQGGLFSAVTAADVIDAVKEARGIELTSMVVSLEDVKETGIHTAKLKSEEVYGSLVVRVFAEGEEIPDEDAPVEEEMIEEEVEVQEATEAEAEVEDRKEA